MIVQFFNMDNFIKTYQEESIVILNKIKFIIHSVASIHLGEINNQRDLIMWKENSHEVFYEKIRYLLNISNKNILFF